MGRRWQVATIVSLLLVTSGATADVVASITKVEYPRKPVPVGSTFGVAVAVKNTGDTAGYIDIRVVEPNSGGLGWDVVTPPYQNQYFGVGETRVFSFGVTATTVGTDPLYAEAQRAGGIFWNEASSGFSVQATGVIPSIIEITGPTEPIPLGYTFALTVKVKNIGALTGPVDIRVVDPPPGGLGWDVLTPPFLGMVINPGTMIVVTFQVGATSAGTNTLRVQAQNAGGMFWDEAEGTYNVTAIDLIPRVVSVAGPTAPVELTDTFQVVVTVKNNGSMSGKLDIGLSEQMGWQILTSTYTGQAFLAGESRAFTFSVKATSVGVDTLTGKARITGSSKWHHSKTTDVTATNVVPTITAATASKRTVAIGERFQVYVTVRNTGVSEGNIDIRLIEDASSGQGWQLLTPPYMDQTFLPTQPRTFVFDVQATSMGTDTLLGQARKSGTTPWDLTDKSVRVKASPVVPTVVSVSPSKSSVELNETLSVTVTVKNTGTNAGYIDVRLTEPAEGALGWQVLTAPLPSQSFDVGQERAFVFDVKATSVGTATLLGQARNTESQSWDESEMATEVTATHVVATVASVSASKASVDLGETFVVTVSVRNTGASSGNLDVRVAESPTGGLGWEVITPPYLNQGFDSNQLRAFTFNVKATTVGPDILLGQARRTGNELWNGAEKSVRVTASNVVAEVLSVTPSKNPVQLNEAFSVAVAVKNPGASSGNLDVRLVESTAGSLGWQVSTTPYLAQPFSPGETRTFSFNVRSTSVGTATLLGQAQKAGGTLWNESQKSAQINSTNVVPLITSITPSKTTVALNETFSVTVEVRNAGTSTGNLDIRLAEPAQGGLGWQVITQPYIDQTFTPSQTRTFSFDAKALTQGTSTLLGQARRSGGTLWNEVETPVLVTVPLPGLLKVNPRYDQLGDPAFEHGYRVYIGGVDRGGTTEGGDCIIDGLLEGACVVKLKVIVGAREEWTDEKTVNVEAGQTVTQSFFFDRCMLKIYDNGAPMPTGYAVYVDGVQQGADWNHTPISEGRRLGRRVKVAHVFHSLEKDYAWHEDLQFDFHDRTVSLLATWRDDGQPYTIPMDVFLDGTQVDQNNETGHSTVQHVPLGSHTLRVRSKVGDESSTLYAESRLSCVVVSGSNPQDVSAAFDQIGIHVKNTDGSYSSACYTVFVDGIRQESDDDRNGRSFTVLGMPSSPTESHLVRIVLETNQEQTTSVAYGDGDLTFTFAAPDVPPAAPADLAAEWTLDGTAVQLVWLDSSNNETSFEVQRATGTTPPDSAYQARQFIDADTTTWSDASVSQGQTYWYRVRAVNEWGVSAWVTARAAQPPAHEPAAPANLAGNWTPDKAILLSWADRSTDERGFRIERAAGSGGFAPVANLGMDAVSWQDVGVTESTTHSYRVRAYNSRGESKTAETTVLSQTFSVTAHLSNGTPVTAGSVLVPGDDYMVDDTIILSVTTEYGQGFFIHVRQALYDEFSGSSFREIDWTESSSHIRRQPAKAGTRYEMRVPVLPVLNNPEHHLEVRISKDAAGGCLLRPPVNFLYSATAVSPDMIAITNINRLRCCFRADDFDRFDVADDGHSPSVLQLLQHTAFDGAVFLYTNAKEPSEALAVRQLMDSAVAAGGVTAKYVFVLGPANVVPMGELTAVSTAPGQASTNCPGLGDYPYWSTFGNDDVPLLPYSRLPLLNGEYDTAPAHESGARRANYAILKRTLGGQGPGRTLSLLSSKQLHVSAADPLPLRPEVCPGSRNGARNIAELLATATGSAFILHADPGPLLPTQNADPEVVPWDFLSVARLISFHGQGRPHTISDGGSRRVLFSSPYAPTSEWVGAEYLSIHANGTNMTGDEYLKVGPVGAETGTFASTPLIVTSACATARDDAVSSDASSLGAVFISCGAFGYSGNASASNALANSDLAKSYAEAIAATGEIRVPLAVLHHYALIQAQDRTGEVLGILNSNARNALIVSRQGFVQYGYPKDFVTAIGNETSAISEEISAPLPPLPGRLSVHVVDYAISDVGDRKLMTITSEVNGGQVEVEYFSVPGNPVLPMVAMSFDLGAATALESVETSGTPESLGSLPLYVLPAGYDGCVYEDYPPEEAILFDPPVRWNVRRLPQGGLHLEVFVFPVQHNAVTSETILFGDITVDFGTQPRTGSILAATFDKASYTIGDLASFEVLAEGDGVLVLTVDEMEVDSKQAAAKTALSIPTGQMSPGIHTATCELRNGETLLDVLSLSFNLSEIHVAFSDFSMDESGVIGELLHGAATLQSDSHVAVSGTLVAHLSNEASHKEIVLSQHDLPALAALRPDIELDTQGVSPGSTRVNLEFRTAGESYRSDMIYVDLLPDAVTDGALRVVIEPEGARNAGAQWRVDEGAWRNSGETITVSAGQYTLSFKDLGGGSGGCSGSTSSWNTPPSQTISIEAGQTKEITGTYTSSQKTLTAGILDGSNRGDLLLLAVLVTVLVIAAARGRGAGTSDAAN